VDHIIVLGAIHLRRVPEILATACGESAAWSQRAYGLISHEGCSCLDEGCEPFISRQDALSRYRVGCVAVAPYRASGLVLWHETVMA
jgi:hypothetical protein